MSKARAERLTRYVPGNVLNDMLKACHAYKDQWRLRPDRVEMPADQFDRLATAMEVKQIDFADISHLERKLGQMYDGGAPIKIELRATDKIEAVRARGAKIIEPPAKPRKIILPGDRSYGTKR